MERLRASDVVEVEIDAIGLDGSGRAKLAERTLTIIGGFGGERAQARLEHVSKQQPTAHARVVELTRAHPGRRQAPCLRHRSRDGRCTGCPLMELSESAQLDQKLTMLRALGLEVSGIHEAPEPLGYRHSSKRVVFRMAGEVHLGSFQRGSHRTATMEGCVVEHPLIRKAADELARMATTLRVSTFDERDKSGLLRYVWLKTNGKQVVVTLIGTGEPDEATRKLAARLPVAAVGWSIQSASTNAVRGDDALLLHGQLPPGLEGEDKLGFLSFLQPNPHMATVMYDATVRDEQGIALEGKTAWDLYSGTGATLSRLAHRFEKVEACESYPESAAALGIAPVPVHDFLAAKTEAPDTIVANPPRKGLSDAVCTELKRLGAARLHILSCGPEGLARDLARLGSHYEILSLEAFDTLPQTPHVELLARLRRRL